METKWRLSGKAYQVFRLIALAAKANPTQTIKDWRAVR